MKRKHWWVVITVIVLALFLVLAGYFFVHTFIAGDPVRTEDIADYSQREANSLYFDLLLFPETVSDENAEYDYYYQDFLFDPSARIYLKCTYTEEAYAAEMERMEPYYVEDSEHFDRPVFIQVYDKNCCYEYAVPDEENLTITYVYLQFISDSELRLDSSEKPLDYQF